MLLKKIVSFFFTLFGALSQSPKLLVNSEEIICFIFNSTQKLTPASDGPTKKNDSKGNDKAKVTQDAIAKESDKGLNVKNQIKSDESAGISSSTVKENFPGGRGTFKVKPVLPHLQRVDPYDLTSIVKWVFGHFIRFFKWLNGVFKVDEAFLILPL